MTTSELSVPVGRLYRSLRLPDGTAALVIGVPAAAALGAVAVLHPEWWRALLAGAVAINLIVVAMKWPRAAAMATLLWLPFLALVRRLLIADAGWTQNDPLLLVGPVVALFLCYRIFVVERRGLAPDRLSKLVVLLLVLAFFGAFNPFGTGGVIGGLAGLIYLGVPLLWFLIGRELGERRTVTTLIYAVVVVSVGIGAYGLFQTQYGSLPQWDVDWFQITGYSGANLGRTDSGEVLHRPWGTFSSNSEYSGYLAFGVVFALAMLYHRRPALVLALPVLCLAIVLAGGRSVVALTLLTAVVLTALRTRNRVIALLVVVLGIGATYGVALALGEQIDRAANLSGNAAAERQAGGLLSPLDPDESTFLGHWASLLNAMGDGVTNPVGEGTGASNIGSRVTGGEEDRETDIDIGDVFVSLGLVGGAVFIAIIVVSFKTVFGRYLRGKPDPLIFAVAGILVVNFGQWLQGGHYAASALMWFLLGWAAKPSPRSLREESERREDGRPVWSALDPRRLRRTRGTGPSGASAATLARPARSGLPDSRPVDQPQHSG